MVLLKIKEERKNRTLKGEGCGTRRWREIAGTIFLIKKRRKKSPHANAAFGAPGVVAKEGFASNAKVVKRDFSAASREGTSSPVEMTGLAMS